LYGLNHFGFFGSQNSRILTFFGFSHLYLYSQRSIFYQVLATRAYKKGDMDRASGWLEKACSAAKGRPSVKICMDICFLRQESWKRRKRFLKSF